MQIKKKKKKKKERHFGTNEEFLSQHELKYDGLLLLFLIKKKGSYDGSITFAHPCFKHGVYFYKSNLESLLLDISVKDTWCFVLFIYLFIYFFW